MAAGGSETRPYGCRSRGRGRDGYVIFRLVSLGYQLGRVLRRFETGLKLVGGRVVCKLKLLFELLLTELFAIGGFPLDYLKVERFKDVIGHGTCSMFASIVVSSFLVSCVAQFPAGRNPTTLAHK